MQQILNLIFFTLTITTTATACQPESNNQSNAKTQFEIGVTYMDGDGVPENYVEGAKWFRLSADQGYAEAQYALGSMYNWGQGGLPKDEVEAVKFYRYAAEQGYAEAQVALGVRNKNGDGVSQNEKEAAEWFRLAAEQGHARGQYFLAESYRYGRGVPQSLVMSYAWYSLAATEGPGTLGESQRDELLGELTPEQAAKAQEIAVKCFESGYKNCN